MSKKGKKHRRGTPVDNGLMYNRPWMCAQAARGPVLLMVVGGLFALQQAGVVGFSRSWPLLIIAIGVLKLFERMVINRSLYHASPNTPGNIPPPQPRPNLEPLSQPNFPPQPTVRATRYSDFRARATRPAERTGEIRR